MLTVVFVCALITALCTMLIIVQHCTWGCSTRRTLLSSKSAAEAPASLISVTFGGRTAEGAVLNCGFTPTSLLTIPQPVASSSAGSLCGLQCLDIYCYTLDKHLFNRKIDKHAEHKHEDRSQGHMHEAVHLHVTIIHSCIPDPNG